MNYKVTVLGAGLAGCEAALWLAGKGVQAVSYTHLILTKKTTKLTRGYRQPSYVDKTNAATIKSMLPYA